jgi:rhodanese-related sulfurtransferase
MTLPSSQAWAGEERGDTENAAPQLQPGRPAQAPPLSFAGVVTWRTGALAQAVKEGGAVLIDVHGVAPQMLPGAVHFWEGGLAFDDEATERSYDERFQGMLQIVQPDKQRPVVFYCEDAACWGAANAAIRAARAGYTRAGWYRGGLRSWAEAGLPLVQKVPSAVIR